MNRSLPFNTCTFLSLFLLAFAPLALAQTVTLTPGTLTFSAQPVGTTSAAKTVTVKNTSTTKTLNIASIVPSGEFADTTTCTATLGPSATCTLSVTFSPSTVGSIDGAVTLTDNATFGTQIVSITGKGVAPVTLAPSSLSFGNIAVGKTSAAKKITLTNSATPLTMGTVTTSGDYGIFANACTGTIAASKNCTISLTFSPTVTGAVAGTLTIADSGAGSPQVIALSGTGTGTVTNPVSFTPPTLSFSSQPAGTTSTSQTITLTNNGATSLTITSVTPSGDYSETDTCAGQTIAASGGTCTISVAFAPTAAGTIAGTITVVDAATTSPQVASLTGTAVVPLTFSPASLLFTGQVGVGGVPQNATLTNNTGSAIAITNVAVSGDFTQTNNCAGSVGASSSCTFSVTFAPLIKGTLDGAVTVTTSGSATPQVLSLSGTTTTVAAAVARYAYSLEFGSVTPGLLVGYSINPATAALRALQTVQLPSTNYGVVVHPSNKFVYVPDAAQILAYNIGVNGLLQAMSGSPFNLPGGSTLKFTPNGQFGYTNMGAEYSVNLTTGALTQLGTATLGNLPFDVAIAPSVKFLYIPNFKDGTISGFSINQTTGALTAITGSPFAAGDTGPAAVVVSPNGQFLFVGNFSTNNAGSTSVFTINATTGALTAVTGSPFPGSGPANYITTDPTGKFLYIASTGVDAYSINSTTGALTAISGSPYTTPAAAYGVTVDPTGKFLYASIFGVLNTPQTSADVITYSINTTTGALTQIGTEGVDGNQGELLAISTGTKAVTYTPKFAYATNQADQTISEYSITATTGALTAVTGSPLTDANGPQLIAAAPSGAFVYTANANNSISEYTVGATGALTLVTGSPIAGFGSVDALVVDPTSSFLFVLDATNSALDSYTINASTGALTALGSTPAPNPNSQSMTIDPTGTVVVLTGAQGVFYYKANGGTLAPLKAAGMGTNQAFSAAVDQTSQYVFVADFGSNMIGTYALPFGGLLSSVATGTHPRGIVAEPSGKYVYVGNAGDGTISAYSLNLATGALTQIGSAFTSAAGTDSLSVSNDGIHLYAANNGAGSVSIFTINADGTLTSAGTATAGAATTSITTTGTSQ
jgi:6-phosphogluconolactonase (cycloisomerase 2 family)